MLKLDQDEFITQYVTTFLATRAANRYEPGTPAWELAPVGDAIISARNAWCQLMAYGTPPPKFAPPAPELTDAQRHPRVMPKGEFEFDR